MLIFFACGTSHSKLVHIISPGDLLRIQPCVQVIPCLLNMRQCLWLYLFPSKEVTEELADIFKKYICSRQRGRSVCKIANHNNKNIQLFVAFLIN